MGVGDTCLVVAMEDWECCTATEGMTLAILAGDCCSASILVGGTAGMALSRNIERRANKIVESRS